MTYNGAAGDTRAAMEDALKKEGFTPEQINTSYKSLIDALRSVDQKVLLEIANSIWYRQDYTVLPEFVNVNREYYNAEVSSLDFADPVAKDIINGWVDEKTHGRIEEIIDNIPSDAIMYLINAIYFKGIWQYEFDKSKTSEGPFDLNDGGSTVTVNFMKQSTSLSVMHNELFSMVELPYGRGNYSMDVLLPNQGFTTDDIVNSLTAENWNNWIMGMSLRNVDLVFPRFTFEYKNELKSELTAMGMGLAFTDDANFSGITGQGNLKISRVIHKSFVEVNEEGTEAAAVTAVEMVLTSGGGSGSNLLFQVDRPFLFAIRETTTGAILFIGRVQNPLIEGNGTM
jgi:serpin B